jgi:hypothetical protein
MGYRTASCYLFAAALSWIASGIQSATYGASFVSDGYFTLNQLQDTNPAIAPNFEAEVSFTLNLLGQLSGNQIPNQAIIQEDPIISLAVFQQVREESSISLQSIITSLSRIRLVGEDDLTSGGNPLPVLPQASVEEIYQGLYGFTPQNPLLESSETVPSASRPSVRSSFSGVPDFVSTSLNYTSVVRGISLDSLNIGTVRQKSPASESSINSAISPGNSPQRIGLALENSPITPPQYDVNFSSKSDTELKLGMGNTSTQLTDLTKDFKQIFNLSFGINSRSLSPSILPSVLNATIDTQQYSPIFSPQGLKISEIQEKTREQVEKQFEQERRRIEKQQREFSKKLQQEQLERQKRNIEEQKRIQQEFERKRQEAVRQSRL